MTQEPSETEFSQSEPAPLPSREERAGEDENLDLTEGQPKESEQEAQRASSIDELEAEIREIEATTGGDEGALIKGLTALVRPLIDCDSNLEAKFQLSKCENIWKLGIIANRLHDVVTQTMKWGPWVANNFLGVSASTVKYSRDIASRPDCHPYFQWGIKRVVKLISLTRKDKGDNPIPTFLKKLDIAYDPNAPLTLEMKAKIDERLAEAGKKPKKPVSVDKLTSILKKHADEFVKASAEELQKLDAEKKGELAAILRTLVTNLS